MAIDDIDASDRKLMAQARAAAVARAAETARENARAAAATTASRAALTKLTSGATLTNTERATLNMAPVTPAATTYNQRVVEAIKTGNTANVDVNANPVKVVEKPTWVKAGTVMTINGPVDVDANGRAADGSIPISAPADEKTKTFTWTDPDTGQTRTFNSAEELTAFVTTWSTTRTIKANQDAKAEEERRKKEAENAAKKTAQQEFRASLTEMGLADLADTVDEFIRNDYTAAQIKLELPKQAAYKLRFPGMEALRKAGQAINEATYISMEKGYLQTLGAYGLDAGLFGTRAELGKYIANLVSPREFEERVNIAKTRVADNTDVVKQLKGYYPEIDDAAVVSYLLNPEKGMDVIKKQVRAAEIGAAATFAGFSDLGGKGNMGTGYAESLIGATGTADLAALKKDFGQAKTLARTQSRLAGIEGQTYNDTEAVNAAIAQEQASILASQRRAERETKFRFGGTSGVSSTSLRSTTNQ